MKKLFPFFILVFILGINTNVFSQTYLSEDFESAFTGTPAAPPGWTQSQAVMIGDGVPEAINTVGEKDWEQNTWTGAAWSKVPTTPGITPGAGAQSGTNVLWMNDITFTQTGSRRLESPVMNLTSAASPYVRFYLFYGQASSNLNLRVMASSDNGVTWKPIMSSIMPNADITGTFAATTPWQRISILIPVAYRTANCKIGIEHANVGATANVFIDNLTVQEFSPATITATGSGNWSSTTPDAPWPFGVMPTADNHVVIPAGMTVSVDVNAARMQNLVVNGIFQYGTTTATQLVQIYGTLAVNAGGTYNSWFSTTGKRTLVGGNVVNVGNLDFSVGAGNLVWIGGAPATFTNSGTIVGGRISNCWHNNSAGVTYNSPVTVANTIGLYNGVINPNGNLTAGNVNYALTQTFERSSQASLASAPIFAAGVTRSVAYISSSLTPFSKTTFSPGAEVQVIGGLRTIAGTLTMTMHDNLSLNNPLYVGTGSSGVLALTRGIIIASTANPLILNQVTAGVVGTAPSTATPPINHGSYVVGPIRIKFTSNGVVTTRNAALGSGTGFNGSVPNANALRTVTFTTTSIPWTGSDITCEMVNSAPSGTVNSPLTALMGIRAYKLTLNNGVELPNSATITYNWGTDDALSGAVTDIRVAQSPAITGPWTERSVSSATGLTTAGSRLTTGGLTLTGNPFFAFATASTAATMQYNTSKAFTPFTSPVFRNSAVNQQIIGVQVYTTGSATTPINVTSMDFNTAGSTNPADIANAKVYYTATPTFATTVQFGTTILNPSGLMTFTGTQALPLGNAYFWLAYDVNTTAGIGNQLDGTCTAITMDGGVGTVAPTITNPAGSRTVYDYNYGGGASFNANYYYANISAGLTGNQQPVYNWIDNSTHTVVGDAGWTPNAPLTTSPGDDGYAGPFTIPFSFTYFGNTYTQFWIGTNGWITFSDPSPLSQSQMRAVVTMPSSGGIENYIAGATKDLDVTTVTYADAKVTYNGDANREVITFFHAHSFASTTDWITFQIILLPNGNVKIQYNDLETPSPAPTGITNACVVGMENVDGSKGIQYRLNGVGGPMISSPMAVEFGLNPAALPVELTSFTAAPDRNDVTLNWSTASEQNNAGFNIERKLSGTESWVSAGFVQGIGNSNTQQSYTYKDSRVNSGRYNYRLKQTDFNGNYHYYDLSGEVVVGLPSRFDLSQNYPNPFNPTTKIDYALPLDGKVSMKLYDITGREVASLINNELMTAGYYTYSFSGVNLASGTYFYRLNVNGQSKSFTMTKKMMLVK
jgi:hypothetical protein